MARKSKAKQKAQPQNRLAWPLRGPVQWLLRQLRRVVLLFVGIICLAVSAGTILNPPFTHTMWVEKGRLGQVDYEWVPLEDVAPVMARSVVAAEDANFCLHWGFDLHAIRSAVADGGTRGASTISQQVVKNVYLWQGRSWFRKSLEALLTPLMELTWSKRRIVEVYLNVAEFGEGVFGVESAARNYFDRGPEALTPHQAALLASVLPSPRTRSVVSPDGRVSRRAVSVADGAATIDLDGRADCFQRPE